MDLSPAFTQLHQLGRDLVRFLPNLALALVVFGLFFLASKAVRGAVRNVAQRRRQHANVGIVLGRLAQLGIVALGALVGVTIVFPTFRPGDLITLLGIGGVAIGFAFKDIFQNFLAGILILVQQPFRVGDQIRVGEMEGTVEDIQTRATYLKTYDGRRVVIPNSELYTGKVIVNTAYDRIRLQYDVGIGYGDDIARARAVMLDVLRQAESVLDDPAPEVLALALDDWSVKLRMLWWIRPPQRIETLRASDQVITALAARLAAEGIDVPFPTYQILLHDQTETTDGDRGRQREGWPAGRSGVPGPRRRPDAPVDAGDDEEAR